MKTKEASSRIMEIIRSFNEESVKFDIESMDRLADEAESLIPYADNLSLSELSASSANNFVTVRGALIKESMKRLFIGLNLIESIHATSTP